MLDTALILDTALALKERHSSKDIAASSQRALAYGFAEMATRAARKENVDAIGVSGGVAYNDAIVRNLRIKLHEKGFELFTHAKVPPGDGCISLGQACIAIGKEN